ncbi:MAG: hypothetical protein WC725_05360 [Patescibacteria group bacterium]|jgi:hypothetical protein
MNNLQLQRTLRLLRRTGDRGIVLDTESDEVFVLMDADAYEKMLPGVTGLHPQKKEEGEPGLDDYELDDLLEIAEKQKAATEIEKITPVEPKPATVPAAPSKKLNFSENWVAEKTPILSEESLADVPHEEEEEEKFYLEPVE